MSKAELNIAAGPGTFDLEAIRADFPILKTQVRGKPMVFLDSAASAQKPQAVIDAMRHCYEAEYANIHRGVYYLSQVATENYETARVRAQKFLNAASHREIIFVRGATEGINLVAQSWGRNFMAEGDEVILSEMEHHANIVPWQMLRDQIGIVLKVVPINDRGELIWEDYQAAFSDRTKLVAMTHVSNALGTIISIAEIIETAHGHGVPVLVDGCQAVPHMPVDVQALDADFYVFSGHKLYGPSGIGVLYGKSALLESMPPYQGGGDMIASVTFEKTTYNDLPYKFEAGTPHIAGAIGLGAAMDYVDSFDRALIAAHEQDLLALATTELQALNRVRLIGTAKQKESILSFTIDGVHPHDIGTILDDDGIAVRAGHHCAQPVMDHFGIPATTRASFSMHNGEDDVAALVKGIRRVMEIFD